MFYGDRPGRPDFMPTYDDAEVQVFDPISPELITEVWVETEKAAHTARSLIASLPKGVRSVSVGLLQTLRDDRTV